MFCPECGKMNADELEACAYCGALLEDNSASTVSFGSYAKKGIDWIKNTALPTILKHKKWGIPIAIIVVLAIGFYSVGSFLSNPQRIATQYVDGIKAKNWDKIYTLLDLEESDFINLEHFVKYCKTNSNNYSDITSYDISDTSFSKNNQELIKTYAVSYVTSGASSESTFELKLVKQEDKFLLFFPTYKISTQNMLGELSLRTYPGSKVSVDGVEISSYHTDEDGYANFSAAPIFQGEHTLKTSHKLVKDYKENFNVGSSIKKIDVLSSRLKDGVSNEIAGLTQANFKIMCEGAIAGKEFKDLGLAHTKNDDDLEDLLDQYESFAERIKDEDGTGLTHITLSNFSDRSSQSSLNNKMTYRCNMNFDYTYTYTYNYGDEVREESSDRTNNGYIAMTYAYENGTWVISSIDNYSLYY